jgi:hypothetical protein
VIRFYRRRLRKSKKFIHNLTKMPTQLSADAEVPEIRVKTAYNGYVITPDGINNEK